ncbi:hypothetical protein RND71_043898 [Anisodus tanguticus]|uniref:Uncharacterized protein n=1 Tax=Anisodus tanguticus TaxID=243964 RepID=A0AAE1QRB0_9SOLA|nr:hypothetical protein RND71_043898 [Anisodus tanguticus]
MAPQIEQQEKEKEDINGQVFNINCTDPIGRSALLMAIDNENLDMIELLVECGVEMRDSLLHAINEEFVEAVELLLDYEEALQRNKKTALELSLSNEDDANKTAQEKLFSYNYDSRPTLIQNKAEIPNEKDNNYTEQADTEWKFARTKLWMSYFEDGATRKAKQASQRDHRYLNVIRVLVRRYITNEQRIAERKRGVTEDDCSGDESSDSEMMMNENQESTNINDESYNVTKKLKKNNIKNENEDDLISGISSDDQQSVYRRSKIKSVDDSDSNTSSNLVQRNSPLFNNKANFSNFGKTDLNYSSNENGFSNLGSSENRERFFNYSSVGRNHDQNQVQYNSNRIPHHPQYHISYSSISSVVPTTNLTYVQSQQHLNENPLYNLNTIHSHQYLSGKHQAENFQSTNPPSSNLPSHQNQITQDLNIMHPPQHNSVYHHHHVPSNLNHHNASYSLLQSSYQADCMLAQQTHQLHQPTANVNVQQLNQNSIYYPPIPQAQNTLTQQLSPQQVQSGNRINNCESSTFINPLASTKLHLNSLNDINKCDENNNSDNNLTNSSSQENGLTSSTLENT